MSSFPAPWQMLAVTLGLFCIGEMLMRTFFPEELPQAQLQRTSYSRPGITPARETTAGWGVPR
jgi:hypothetical protein